MNDYEKIPSKAETMRIVRENYENLFKVGRNVRLFLDPFDSDYSFCLDNASIRILPKRDFEFAYSEGDLKLKKEAKGICGFVHRNKPNSIHKIYVKNESLAEAVLTIGHELGHLMTARRDNEIIEESKAYAFESWWLESVLLERLQDLPFREEMLYLHNSKPSGSRVHQKAFDFLMSRKKMGYSPSEIFYRVIEKEF